MPETNSTVVPRFEGQFARRHIGPSSADITSMLAALGFDSLDAMTTRIVPEGIAAQDPLALPAGLSEEEAVAALRQMADQNQLYRSWLGLGYYGCHVPSVIQRNILENPGWYTQYTPYQAEIAQGRLEALFNFQTMVCELTGMEIANASLLDEGTAVAEAMTMALRVNRKNKSRKVLMSERCHPQTLDVVKTRALPLGIDVEVGNPAEMDLTGIGAVILQYPDTDGRVENLQTVVDAAHEANALVIVATDLLALTLLTPPGEWDADIVVGSSQRFGVPLGYGGPHAAFMATREAYRRSIPGRIVGQSIDKNGGPAFRLALQTREQHIRREKATSNICTAQVLLAVMASMYGVYHGPGGLKAIAQGVHDQTVILAAGLKRLGFPAASDHYFDTLRVSPRDAGHVAAIKAAAEKERVNLRHYSDGDFGVALDETTTPDDVAVLWRVFNGGQSVDWSFEDIENTQFEQALGSFARTSGYMAQEVFHAYHSETEFLRYVTRLQNRDLSLTTSMIPLGSCTMKLNATTEMLAVTWPEFSGLHPFAPPKQAAGYARLFEGLAHQLAEITGMDGVSLQPNAGSQGEYAGMLAIRAYHEARGEGHRNVCLIPQSAHGTNPASAVMAGMEVVVVRCDADGNTDLDDLRAKAAEHKTTLSALMITYPSTHGVFETHVRDVCAVVHEAGGQVYLDGANLNAQVGLCRPGDYGADVCHLNLHKTFCIPHGGGGPGMGPIVVKKHLAPYLPGHPLVPCGGDEALGPISAAPWGSASILPISWSYIAMLGGEGLTQATQVAILNANYMAHRLAPYFPILYQGNEGLVAHEFILDLRPFKESTGVEVVDVAKRLMDYGYHAPTISWPVAGTMMVEPTESESKAELDRFCDAMISIHGEIKAIEAGTFKLDDNPLKNAPHTAAAVTATEWNHCYTREQAAYPTPWTREAKFWPPTGRIDDAYGDRNLICSCPSPDAYAKG